MSMSVSRAGVRLAVGAGVLGDAFNAGVSSRAGRRPTGTRGHGDRSTTRGAPPDFGSNAHRPAILSSESGRCKFAGQLQIREALVYTSEVPASLPKQGRLRGFCAYLPSARHHQATFA